jgi:elongation factor G
MSVTCPKTPEIRQIRNIGIVAHIDAGKTTLTERILYYTHFTHRMGDVDEGTTVTDYLKEEQERGITIVSAAVTTPWRDCWINLIDTPGHVDFTAEVERCLRVLDGAIIVFSAVEGVEAQSETVWRQADRYRVPRLAFINKMDRVGADFEAVVEEMQRRLGAQPLVLTIPLGTGPEFRGVVDLFQQKALYFDQETLGERILEEEIPPEAEEMAAFWRDRLFDTLAPFDQEDLVTSAYLEGKEVSFPALQQLIRHVTIHRAVVPTFAGSALKRIGVQPVLDAVCWYLPSPADLPPVQGFHPKKKEKLETRSPDPRAPFCSLVFKVRTDQHGQLFYLRIYSGTLTPGTRVYNPRTDSRELVQHLWRIYADRRERMESASAGDIVGLVGPKNTVTGDTLCDPRHPIALERIQFPETVVSASVEPMSSAERQRLHQVLGLLAMDDPTFQWRVDEETGQVIMSGMGELHLEILKNRMQDEFGLKVRIGKPRVSYRETLAEPLEVTGVCHQQVAGQLQHAEVRIRVEPAPGTSTVTIQSELQPGQLRSLYEQAVLSALQEESRGGGHLGYPLTDVRITVSEVRALSETTSEVAFRVAAAQALRRALQQGKLLLLEPIMRLEVLVPEEYLGDVLADLNARRAEILNTYPRGHLRVIEARVPLERVFGYATVVRSLSQGRASYTLEPDSFAPAPEEKLRQLLG